MGTGKQRVLEALTEFATIILIGVTFLLIYIFVLFHPFDRGFYCTDETIRFPYRPDTVPMWAAGFYSVTAGFLIVIVSELYLTCAQKEKFNKNQRIQRLILNSIHGILLYGLGALSTLLITEIGKHTVGRLRPHFLDVCKPKWDELNCFTKINDIPVANYIKYHAGICTGDPDIIREARRSFPSGHSSFTTYSMAFVIIYLEARLVFLHRAKVIKPIIQLIAFIAAWHTCMSRVSDFKHHYTDVIAGACIGFSVAIFVSLITGKKLWTLARFNDVADSLNLNAVKESDENFEEREEP